MRCFALSLGSGIVALVAVELALRVVAPVPTGDESLRARFTQTIPGVRGEIVYERNVLGLRTRSVVSPAARPGAVRILCLGASSTDQATQGWEDTWCGLLERELNAALAGDGIAVETAAYGRGGATAADAVAELERQIPAIRPDLVIALLGVNDLTWRAGAVGAAAPDSSGAQDGKREDGSAIARCARALQICRRLAAIKRRLRAQHAEAEGRVIEWHSQHLPEIRERFRRLRFVAAPTRTSDPLPEFSRGVGALVDTAVRAGVDVLLLGQPV